MRLSPRRRITAAARSTALKYTTATSRASKAALLTPHRLRTSVSQRIAVSASVSSHIETSLRVQKICGDSVGEHTKFLNTSFSEHGNVWLAFEAVTLHVWGALEV